MVNQKTWRIFAITTAAVTATVLLIKPFGIEVGTNLFNTGITPSAILGVANIVLAWALWKRRV